MLQLYGFIYKISIYLLAGLEIISLFKANYFPWFCFLTFDLEGWPWPWTFTTQNVQLHEIHMHTKYQVAIFNIAKVMTNVKVFGRTHRRTDRRTDSSTAICHPTGSIKMKFPDKYHSLLLRETLPAALQSKGGTVNFRRFCP